MSDANRDLQRIGHAANQAGDLAHAREAFLEVVRLTGRVEARVSAANMLCKMAQAEGADIGTAGFHAEMARREYEGVLASTDKAAVRALCQQRQAELSALLSTLDARASAEARATATSELSKRKRGAVSTLEEGVCDMLAPPPPLPAGQPRPSEVLINRSPVRVLWAAVNAHRLGLSWPEALSIGSALAGLVARAKGRALGIHPGDELADQAALSQNSVGLMGQRVPVVNTEGGLRGLSVTARRGRATGAAGASDGAEAPLQPVRPAAVFSSLTAAFGPNFGEVYFRMAALAASVPRDMLRQEDNALAERLYCEFRPQIPEGRMGWGQAGRLLLSSASPGASLSSPAHGRGGSAAGRVVAPTSLAALAQAQWDSACRRVQVSDSLAAALAAGGEAGQTLGELAAAATAHLATGAATSTSPPAASASPPERSPAQRVPLPAASQAARGRAAPEGKLGVSEEEVRRWLEEQQLDGAAYRKEGRFFPA